MQLNSYSKILFGLTLLLVITAVISLGIGGVLEPLQANPTTIGDNCFIGAR